MSPTFVGMKKQWAFDPSGSFFFCCCSSTLFLLFMVICFDKTSRESLYEDD